MGYSAKEELSARATTVIGMLLFGAWFVKSPGWDSFAAFFVAVSSFIAFEYKAYKQKSNNNMPAKHDAELFNKFMEDLPSISGSIEFVRNHDFCNSFRLERLDELFNFARRWDGAEKEFLNTDLEHARKNLLHKINEFLDNSKTRTCPDRNGLQSVYYEAVNEEEHEEIKNDIKILNQLGNDVYTLHQKLIRTAKQNLIV